MTFVRSEEPKWRKIIQDAKIKVRMMSDERRKELPADLEKFRDSYVEMFGTLPPLPAARFEFSGEVNPEFLRVSEQLRKGAFYSRTCST